LGRSFELEQPVPADISLTILRLSFRAVKGNINLGALSGFGQRPKFDAVQHADEGCKIRELKPKNSSRFAFEQTRFALGQVSHFRSG